METIDGKSPSQAGFSIRGAGRSVRNYIIGDDGNGQHTRINGTSEIYSSVVEILGETRTHEDGIRLKRTLPLADPVFQWLICESIGNVAGLGNPGAAIASNPYGILEAPTVDYFALYPAYAFSGVTFTPRPYASLKDDDIPTGTLVYTDVEGTTQTSDYAQEWLRYTDVETVPAGEYITAQAGQFVFDVASGFSPDGRPAGNGQLRMFVKRKMIKVTWYCVPYEYIDTGDSSLPSWIELGLGCVNQFDWWNYKAGSMLLEGVMVNRYTPAVPKSIVWNGSGLVSYANQKLCDISFMFSHLYPVIGKDTLKIFGLEAGGNRATPRAPKNDNVIQAGHNLVPYAHQMGWFYARTKIPGYTASDNQPLYPSFPFQLLFANPGVTV